MLTNVWDNLLIALLDNWLSLRFKIKIPEFCDRDCLSLLSNISNTVVELDVGWCAKPSQIWSKPMSWMKLFLKSITFRKEFPLNKFPSWTQSAEQILLSPKYSSRKLVLNFIDETENYKLINNKNQLPKVTLTKNSQTATKKSGILKMKGNKMRSHSYSSTHNQQDLLIQSSVTKV